MASVTRILVDDTGAEHRVELSSDGTATVDGVRAGLRRARDGSVRISAGGRESTAWTAAAGTTRWVFLDGQIFAFEVRQRGTRRPGAGGHHGSLTSPMPATVIKINVAAGDAIARGDVLVVLEAMKMELPVRAPADGRVVAVNCSEGELVQPGLALIEIED